MGLIKSAMERRKLAKHDGQVDIWVHERHLRGAAMDPVRRKSIADAQKAERDKR